MLSAATAHNARSSNNDKAFISIRAQSRRLAPMPQLHYGADSIYMITATTFLLMGLFTCFTPSYKIIYYTYRYQHEESSRPTAQAL